MKKYITISLKNTENVLNIDMKKQDKKTSPINSLFELLREEKVIEIKYWIDVYT